MHLVRCTADDLPARMCEIQWQAMWRYYILPGQLRVADASFEAGARASDWVLDACHIAVDDQRDAGFCWAALRGDEGWCGGFGVRPEFRRRGVGNRLLQATAEALRQHGARVWRLEVVQHNVGAVTAYLRAGFSQGRDLGLFRGRVEVPLARDEEIVETSAAACFDRYPAWPQIRRTWGSSPDCLRRNQAHYSAKELRRGGEPVAFLVHGGSAVVDCGLAPGEPGTSGVKLIATLGDFTVNNFPSDDPVRQALDVTPGAVCWVKQWEMIWDL